MKRLSRLAGVTLLEIMLVLAVASLVVVMSIRYYQSTQIAVATQTVQRGVAVMLTAAESIGLAAGSYKNVSADALAAALPPDMRGSTATKMKLGGNYGEATISMGTGGASDNSYTAVIEFPTTAPASFCAQAAAIANSTAVLNGGSGTCSAGKATWTVNLVKPST